MKKKSGVILSLCILISIVFSQLNIKLAYAETSGLQWERNLNFGSDDLYSIAYNEKDLYVAVGRDGIVKNSKDLITWKPIKLNTNNSLLSVIWDGKQFMAVGGYEDFNKQLASSDIYTSKDGQVWEKKNINTTELLFDVTYNGNKYVVVGKNGAIFTSNDGQKWDEVDSPAGKDALYGIVWSGKKFVAVGGKSYAYGTILTSEDGTTWIKVATDAKEEIKKIAYNGSKFVAVGNAGILLTSNDGATWAKSDYVGSTNFVNVTWNSKGFIAISDDGKVLTSSDGMKWQEVYNKLIYKTTDVIWDGQRFVFSGTNSKAYDLSTSIEPVTEKVITTLNLKNRINSTEFSNIAYNGKTYIAVGGYNLYNSQDAENWKLISKPIFYSIKDIVWTGEKLVLVGEKGGIYTSIDGEVYEKKKEIPTTDNLNGIAWNGKIFVAVGGDKTKATATMLTSTDGVKWDKVTLPVSYVLNSVVWAGNKFVAVGGNSSYGTVEGRTILTSIDGVNWTGNGMETGAIALNKIVWNGNKCLAVGTNATVTSSMDGVTWTESKLPIDKYTEMYSVLWNGMEFISVGESGNIVRSKDGINWEVAESPTYNTIKGIVWDGKKYVAVGNKGTILYGSESITPSEGEIEIKLVNEVTELKALQDAKVSFMVTNNTKQLQNVTLIMAVYDKDNVFLNYVCVKKSMNVNETSDLSGMVKLIPGATKVKCFVWDSIENMKPLSKVVEIPVK